MFKKATKKKQKLRLLLEAAAGAGKTYSALLIAKGLGHKIAVIDTEKGSASLYDKLVDFDVCELNPPYSPNNYIQAINEAEKAGYDVLIIDSISHEWSGKGGCLEMQQKLGGRFQDWAQVTPQHTKFIEAILQSNMHIVATARTKSDWAMDVNERGKIAPTKVGLKTEQRDGLDFEFTTVFRLNQNHIASASKDRTGLFEDWSEVITENVGKQLSDWLEDGESENKQINNQTFDSTNNDCDGNTTRSVDDNIDNESIVEDFKTRIKKLLEPKKIKMFMKRNGLNVKDVDSIKIFMSEHDLELAVAAFEEEL